MMFALLKDLFCCDSLAVQAVSSPIDVSTIGTLFPFAVGIEYHPLALDSVSPFSRHEECVIHACHCRGKTACSWYCTQFV